jgi:hypothetical protein
MTSETMVTCLAKGKKRGGGLSICTSVLMRIGDFALVFLNFVILITLAISKQSKTLPSGL